MTREQVRNSGIALLVTLMACAVLPACKTPWEVGIDGLVATLGLIAFAICMGED
jgi:hypothetical protein